MSNKRFVYFWNHDAHQLQGNVWNSLKKEKKAAAAAANNNKQQKEISQRKPES